MRFTLAMAAAVAAAALAAPAWGQNVDRAEVALQAAMKKESVDGDLKSAIEQYKKLAQGSNKAIAARALVRLGECYEKQGNTDARKTYEQVLSKFGDQKEAVAQAQARLAAMQKATGAGDALSFRRVWDGPRVNDQGGVSQDGRYLSFTDWETEDLCVRDLSASTDRRLTPRSGAQQYPEFSEESAISRDSKTVAYSWSTGKGYELRTISLQTAAPAQPRRLCCNEDLGWLAPYDWSPDGKWIAVQIWRKNGYQIGLVSAADGSLKVLKSGPGANRMAFSPDGAYLAYDPVADEASQQSDLFVMAVDSGREVAAVTHPANDEVAGWSPDGKRLLFFSDRTGSRALWSQSVSNGSPQGAAELIKTDIGRAVSLGITSAGSLFLGVRVDGPDIQVATIDFAAGRALGETVKPITENIGFNSMPAWSADGKSLAYISHRADGVWLAVRELETGRTREFRPQISNIYNSIAWSPDGRSFAVPGMDKNGKPGLFLMDASNGEVSPLALNAHLPMRPAWSPNGKKIYYPVVASGQTAFVERDLATGAEREVIRRPDLGGILLSPDGNWIATRSVSEADKSVIAIVVPVGGGEIREVFRVTQPQNLNVPMWAGDSSSVVVKKAQGTEVWRVPITGGEPRKLDLKSEYFTGGRGAILHPDGRQIAYVTGERKLQIWMLENFLPKAAK